MRNNKTKKSKLAELRERRNSYRDKARECAVYDNARGYRFWMRAANETSDLIMALDFPDVPKTPRSGLLSEFIKEEAARASEARQRA